ncbi:MAG: xylose isomerase, partial [Firmicutes bacterium]|nr:xylose isomerase [Bacillota bacterium]
MSNIGTIKYEGAKSTNPLSFKFYNPTQVVGGKTMREQLKFAMSYWHTLCSGLPDIFGEGTIDKSFGKTA